jgi:SNF2 family DNA or RNA helicase
MKKIKKPLARTITHPKETPALTIEEKEMKMRLDSAGKTPFKIKVLEESYFPFTSFEVTGATQVCYTVEIRSLSEKINSCSCPDNKVNMLGSCKHIEGTLLHIESKGRRRFKALAKMESPRTEIFLNTNKQEVSLRGHGGEEGMILRERFSPYLSSDATKLNSPLMGTASIENALSGLNPEIASKIRLSQHLLDWVKDQHFVERCKKDKIQFLEDVKAGKRSLQMLSCNLLPYQEQGMLHLAFQGRAILADEMGLGKTIQAIAAAELLRRLNRVKRVLIVSPASLKGEWEEQIARFSGLPTLIVAGDRGKRLEAYKEDAFFYLVNYEQVRSDFAEIQAILAPDLMILDEAQRIKNWPTKSSWAVKQLKIPYTFVLSGTPIENKIDEIYSIMQVVDPKILGPLYQFQQDFYKYKEGKAIGYQNLDILHRRLGPVLLRRRKKDVEMDLPERIIKNYMVKMGPEQMLRYEEYSVKVSKLLLILKKRPFTLDEQKKLQQYLACMRMIVDTPYILDEECRESPKLEELEQLLNTLLCEPESKIIIFSEWERMLFLVRELVQKLGVKFSWHTGSVPQLQRREEIHQFKTDPECRLFLTTDSGSTGLNLQVANVVINLDLPWNPAKLEQRIARAWRKNQTKVVQVVNFIAENTIEHRMLSMLSMKQAVADAVLDAIGDLSEMPLPSASRQELIDKLETLTGLSEQSGSSAISDIESEEKKNGQWMQEVLARHSDRIHLLETRHGHMLAVVDKVDPLIKESISKCISGQLELLDFDTYQTLKRLAEAGVITFGSGDKQVLFQSELLKSEQKQKSHEKLQRANIHFKEAERKIKMAMLLLSGGFVEESLPIALDAVKKGEEVIISLEAKSSAKLFELKQLQNDSSSPERLIEAISNWMMELQVLLTEYRLGVAA